MCGRIIVDYEENMAVADDTELASWMIERPSGAKSSWNLKPTEQMPVALTSKLDGRKRLELAHWSIVPPWSKELKLKYPTFNARSESVTEKATFQQPVKQQRCVIPATGFYEWTGTKGAPIPHAVFGPENILPLAGMYSWWRDSKAAEGEGWVLTATVLTQEAAGIMKSLHSRMPVFVDDEILHDWLDPSVEGDQVFVNATTALSATYAERLNEYEVRPLRGDGPELIEPA